MREMQLPGSDVTSYQMITCYIDRNCVIIPTIPGNTTSAFRALQSHLHSWMHAVTNGFSYSRTLYVFAFVRYDVICVMYTRLVWLRRSWVVLCGWSSSARSCAGRRTARKNVKIVARFSTHARRIAILGASSHVEIVCRFDSVDWMLNIIPSRTALRNYVSIAGINGRKRWLQLRRSNIQLEAIARDSVHTCFIKVQSQNIGLCKMSNRWVFSLRSKPGY